MSLRTHISLRLIQFTGADADMTKDICVHSRMEGVLIEDELKCLINEIDVSKYSL